MLNISYTDVPDLEGYQQNIKADGTFVYVDEYAMEESADDFSARCASALNILQMYIGVFSEGRYHAYTPDAFVDTLINFCGCTADQFRLDGRFPSLDKARIIAPLVESLTVRASNPAYKGSALHNALTLLAAYTDYKELFTRRNAVNSKIKRISQSEAIGWSGRALSTIAFRYRQADTGRYYTYDDSIQNWPLELVKAITVPEGYFLVWCDFDQIDFRVGYHLYLREPGTDADKIYLAADDKYQAMYEIICKAADKEPDIKLFKDYRKSYKKAILSAMYNASEKSLINDIKNNKLGHELFDYFNNNKKYQAFRNKITKLLNFGVDATITDYFGFQRSIPMPDPHNPRDVNDAISKCCNTPIQSTSNSILVLWLEKTLQFFESHGFSRTEDVIPYLIRHDECIFMVSSTLIEHLYLFKEVMSVSVDDWDTITLEPHIGINYKEPSEELEQLYDAQCLQHANELTSKANLISREAIYRPIQEVLEIYALDMTPMKQRALAAYNPELDNEIINSSLAECKDSWTENQALDVIRALIEAHPEYAELKEIYDNHGIFLIYSPNYNKYKFISNLDDAIHIATSIKTNKVVVYNAYYTASMIVKGIMFKISNSYAAKTKQLFRKYNELEKPEGWIAL